MLHPTRKMSSKLSNVENLYSLPRSRALPKPNLLRQQRETAVVYCEGFFGESKGKTTNGLVRESNRFKIVSVIDSTKAGQDSGAYLYGHDNGVPICSSLSQAIAVSDWIPEYFIYGLSPESGRLSLEERQLILTAMRLGMNIVIGLHEFLTDDPEFMEAAKKNHVRIIDVIKPRPIDELQLFANRLQTVLCPRILVMGTDCAIGKRTTALALTKVLERYGLNVVMIATGQTGLIQGARYGIALEAIPSQYCVGELEAIVVEAYEEEGPDVIVIEGQGALSHPCFCTSASIIRGSQPHAVILQHSPTRVYLSGSEQYFMPDLDTEIELIELFAGVPVIGITLNSQGLDEQSTAEVISHYVDKYHRPVAELFTVSDEVLVEMVMDMFPELDLDSITI
ncbi:DUF1611 domain-containing protein [Vibrio vulnificus]|uniref:EBNA-1 nuclear protein n=3 Tax=Vibrio vulnificus TaxID=672 RepID=A0A3Q0KYR1_VIBVU|nr:DUF1611 domain-containing protein [Vibrio vulnificus]AAO07610.1 EBNA-1 nuclear protein [Vibrio vulnificus CMCP6]ANN29168.1 Protein often near L-alanine-DL-glutamate epimerase (cell wall recycling) [Vibrio vulnificus]ARN68553.1 Protein often near L-alanine-DL-glutamate epimerase (cell wall recycling) [Vibrio vulnificus]ASC59650.1 Protein often near L-alanine-DL-glutamate epimerase (cell wall recycling) [Vibrio vulnificus]AXX62428.1 Protein often near L-alanine-DL-glutamate epimerase (cell wa